MAAITGIVVYSSVLFNPGGVVRRWANDVERGFTAAAIAAAPVNKRPNTGHGAPGGLKAGISGRVERVGPNQLETIIASSAPYTTFVLFGTRPVITSNPPGKSMPLPANGVWNGHPRVVSGQMGYNFFAAAGMITRFTHPSVRVGPMFRSHML